MESLIRRVDQNYVCDLLTSQRSGATFSLIVFAKEFELSHNSKGSVHFVGYRSPDIDEEEEEYSEVLMLKRRMFLMLKNKPGLSQWTLSYKAFGQNLEYSWVAKNLQASTINGS